MLHWRTVERQVESGPGQGMHTAVPFLQILAAALTECHRKSSAQGKPLALKVFVAGRNRLENDGATALAEAFGVSHFFSLLCQTEKRS